MMDKKLREGGFSIVPEHSDDGNALFSPIVTHKIVIFSFTFVFLFPFFNSLLRPTFSFPLFSFFSDVSPLITKWKAVILI